MENQHRKITGYRELNQDEIDLMNQIKHQGRELKVLYDKAADHIKQDITPDPNERMRWLNIGRTGYQQALMALTRAVAAPDFE
jgi:hypothetical protein